MQILKYLENSDCAKFEENDNCSCVENFWSKFVVPHITLEVQEGDGGVRKSFSYCCVPGFPVTRFLWGFPFKYGKHRKRNCWGKPLIKKKNSLARTLKTSILQENIFSLAGSHPFFHKKI